MPATPRVQYRAECVACSREFAVGRDLRLLVDHGFTLPWDGSGRNGRCFGVGRPHFGLPEGRDLAAKIADSQRSHAASLRLTAKAVRLGEVAVLDRKGRKIETPTEHQRLAYAQQMEYNAQSVDYYAEKQERRVAAWTLKGAVKVEIEDDAALPADACPGSRKPYAPLADSRLVYRRCSVCNVRLWARGSSEVARLHRVKTKHAEEKRFCLMCGVEKTRDNDTGDAYRCPKGRTEWSFHCWRRESSLKGRTTS